MKVKLDRELIISKMQKAIKFVPTKTLIPAFDNFKMSVKNGKMTIVASDGNIQVTTHSIVNSKDEFSFCLPARLLLKTLSLFRENDVTITKKSEVKYEIKSGKSKYNINTSCHPNDFPMIFNEGAKHEINVYQPFLAKALKMTQKFVDEKTINANLLGIKIENINNNIIFTGADGIIMCRFSIKPLSITTWDKLVIHTDVASKVASLLSDRGEIGISASEEKISFFTDSDSADMFDVCSVLSKAKFPDTESFFKKKPENTIVFNTLEMKDAIKRLALYSSTDMPSFIIKDSESRTSVMLSSADTLQGHDGEEEIVLMDNLVHPIQKSFSTDSFIEILNNVDSNDVEFHYNDNDRMPCAIIPCVNIEEEKMSSFMITGRII